MKRTVILKLIGLNKGLKGLFIDSLQWKKSTLGDIILPPFLFQ